MKKKQIIPIDQTPISPVLMNIWRELWVSDPCEGPLTISKYIELFSIATRAIRRESNFLFSQVNLPVYGIVLQMSHINDITDNLEKILRNTNMIADECRNHYLLNRKDRKMLRRTQQRNEDIWDIYSKRLLIIEDAMKKLYNSAEANYPDFEIPLQNDFSVILHDFGKYNN